MRAALIRSYRRSMCADYRIRWDEALDSVLVSPWRANDYSLTNLPVNVKLRFALEGCIALAGDGYRSGHENKPDCGMALFRARKCLFFGLVQQCCDAVCPTVLKRRRRITYSATVVAVMKRGGLILRDESPG